MTPFCRNSPSHTAPEVAMLPEWEATARPPFWERPSLNAMTTFSLSRARSSSPAISSGRLMDSMTATMTRVPSSSTAARR